MPIIFKLKSLSPVGYVIPKQNKGNCICRNPLHSLCVECESNNSDNECNVIFSNGHYLHSHCNTLYNKNIS